MGKHSKNNNDRAFFSYHERKAASYGRLSSSLLGGHNTADGNHVSFGWGSESRTLDGDAMKEIDACSLSLQPCVEPVVTPSGILYDKQVVVEYILSRKKELERELRAWESQEAGQKAEAASEAQQAQQARIDEFVAQQEGLSCGRRAQTHTRPSPVWRHSVWALTRCCGPLRAQTGGWQAGRPQLARRGQERGDRLDDGPLAPVGRHGQARRGHELLGAAAGGATCPPPCLRTAAPIGLPRPPLKAQAAPTQSGAPPEQRGGSPPPPLPIRPPRAAPRLRILLACSTGRCPS